jgi:hypothetical protein
MSGVFDLLRGTAGNVLETSTSYAWWTAAYAIHPLFQRRISAIQVWPSSSQTLAKLEPTLPRAQYLDPSLTRGK